MNKMFACFHLATALLLLGTLKDFTSGLRLVEVRIPNYVIQGGTALLECNFSLDGDELYSVKWYKDGNEFYRYLPRDKPPGQTFLLPGVSVHLHNSSDSFVSLQDIDLQTAGRFRCEVSGEAPSFQTVTDHGDMVVVHLPDQGPPKITGGRPRYQIGDWVRVNCTAGRSKPALNMSWYINGELAEPQKLRKYATIVSGREGLETSVLGLQFRVEQHHFRNGDMKLKCVAALSTLYWRSNEESVEGERPLKAPVLESREGNGALASNSRADPVQASKTDSLLMARAPSALLLLALATAATLAGVTCGGGNGSINITWPASTHSKAHVSEQNKTIKNPKDLKNNIKILKIKQNKFKPNFIELRQKFKRLLRQLRCSVVSEASSSSAASAAAQQQKMLLAAR